MKLYDIDIKYREAHFHFFCRDKSELRNLISASTINRINTFNPDKDASNKAKHGVSLANADLIEWDAALVWTDERKAYGETRLVALAPIDDRLFCCVYVERDGQRRIISLRKANKREVTDYASND